MNPGEMGISGYFLREAQRKLLCQHQKEENRQQLLPVFKIEDL